MPTKCVLRLNCAASLQLGRLTWNPLACVYCVRGSGGMLPRKIFKFKPSKMAGSAFKTYMIQFYVIFIAASLVFGISVSVDYISCVLV